jgi:hypothetical protein
MSTEAAESNDFMLTAAPAKQDSHAKFFHDSRLQPTVNRSVILSGFNTN